MNRPRVEIAHHPSDSTLEATPARVLTFLMAIARRAPIRAAMGEAGFLPEDHAEGWRLLMAVGEISDGAAMGATQSQAAAALVQIHEWVTGNFRRYRVALERLHPQSAFLFRESDSRNPAESLLAMATLLKRLPAQYDGSQESALLETLAQRGLNATEIGRLGQLVALAQSIGSTPVGDDAASDDRTSELVALYHWYRDWVESAKQFVKRKDYRVQLGIAAKHEATET